MNGPTDRTFMIRVEFGNETDFRHGGASGPPHYPMPEPDRTRNNWLPWKPTCEKGRHAPLHFGQDDIKESLKCLQKQSSDRHSVKDDVSDRVKDPSNKAHYGSNRCDTWVGDMVADGLNGWERRCPR